MDLLPWIVVHYSKHDPSTTVGGVETFARNLRSIFSEVRFMTPAAGDRDEVIQQRLPVICDNQHVVDWPPDYPVIGFQHGVGAVKLRATGSLSHRWLAHRQQRAARRPNTLWVACAEWVGREFARLYGNGARHVVRYPVDTDRFDGRLLNDNSRVILHDARTPHKGAALVPVLQRAFPDWQFEPLACPPEQVADRMRKARAFIHLSRYEGNSLVCNEAMAMNLPCLLTRVGLLRDQDGPTDICRVEVGDVFSGSARLIAHVGRFLATLGTRAYGPRDWVLRNATFALARDKWRQVLLDLGQMRGSAGT